VGVPATSKKTHSEQEEEEEEEEEDSTDLIHHNKAPKRPCDTQFFSVCHIVQRLYVYIET
jgi:hypothetical protein